jgi:hypothetical protein
MSEEEGSRKVRKTGSPKGRKKSEVSSPKSEEEKQYKFEFENGEALNKVNPAAEIKELLTENSQLQTETMEVHHHPEVEKKGIKEYILEGLMIFIAVTMGFFAESIRENITNSEHVKQLTVQLVHDLKNDTSTLREIESAETRILAKTDTLSGLLQQPMEKIDMKRKQQLIAECYSQWPFYPSLGGITAIKSELRLKQFSSSKISSYITGYEGRTSILHKLEDIHSKLMSDYLQGFFRLHFTPANLSKALDHQPVVDGQMRDLTQKDLTQLATDLALIRNINSIMITYNRRLKTQAIEMMDYVKKQYGIGDE